jgi:hypothetical protein
MKFVTTTFLIFWILLAQATLASPPATTTTLEDQMNVSVTIYNQNLALIKDQRTISLVEGIQVLDFREVSAQIKPETALLTGDKVTILEQNFEFDLLTPQALLEKYVGREVLVVKTHPTTGEETQVKATVLSAQNGVVLQIGDHIESGIPGRLIFPDVPENLRDRPTLTMLAKSETKKDQDIELSYLTSGLGWQADYVAELNARDDALNISGWVTLTNQSGAAYNNASLQLVAGDVHRAPREQMNGHYGMVKSAPRAMADDDGMSEEQMFEYHLYTLERPTTLKDNQTKQVALMQASEVPCRKEFLLRGNAHYYRGQAGNLGQKIKVGVFVELTNSEKNNLGMPLPKGIVRVYKKDSKDRLQFVGEDRIDHTPKNETIRLKLGDAFDVTANKKQTNFEKVSGTSRHDYVYESTYRIELKNGKEEAVTVKVVEPVPGDWKMLQESIPHEKETSNTAVWQVPVPALGSTVLTYKVRVTH